jgi:hypothetical protein
MTGSSDDLKGLARIFEVCASLALIDTHQFRQCLAGGPPYRSGLVVAGAARSGVPHPSRPLRRVGGTWIALHQYERVVSPKSCHPTYTFPDWMSTVLLPTLAKNARVGHPQLERCREKTRERWATRRRNPRHFCWCRRPVPQHSAWGDHSWACSRYCWQCYYDIEPQRTGRGGYERRPWNHSPCPNEYCRCP